MRRLARIAAATALASTAVLETDVKAGALKVTTVKVDPWLLGVGVAYRF